MALFEEKDRYIEEIATQFFLQAGRLRNLDGMVRAVVESFRVLDGKFVPQAGTPTIRLRMNAITNAYLSWRDPNYLSRVEDYLLELENIDDFVFGIQEIQNGIAVNPTSITPAKRLAIDRVTEQLTRENYDRFYKNRVREGLVDFVSNGRSINEFENWLEQRVTRPDYLKYTSFNGAMQYDGDIQGQIAEVYELDGILYAGSIVRDSRPQCRRWVRKRTLARMELESEINWMERNGDGYIRGTTPSNFYRYRGGHNCRHQAIPVLLNN